MTGGVYYNDNEPFVAEWLRNLIAAGLIPAGDVDDRSIVDVSPGDLAGYRQCHLFAGIAGWSRALDLAGWPAGRPVWTASCPCQPLSSAGNQAGHADERHLWPAVYRLIAECRPATIFGEQVVNALGREWFSGVRADLEHLGYAVGAGDLPAACVGAPHIRQRLFWVADAGHDDRATWPTRGVDQSSASISEWAGSQSPIGGLGNPGDERLERGGWSGSPQRKPSGRTGSEGCSGLGEPIQPRLERYPGNGDDRGQPGWVDQNPDGSASEASAYGGLGDADRGRREGERQPQHRIEPSAPGLLADGSGAAGRGFWADSVWLQCADGKARRTQPGIFPLADGTTSRVGRLRAYGNAIVPQVAAAFIRAVMECLP